MHFLIYILCNVKQTTMVEMSQLVLQESASQLPPETPIESMDPPQDAGFQILTEAGNIL